MTDKSSSSFRNILVTILVFIVLGGGALILWSANSDDVVSITVPQKFIPSGNLTVRAVLPENIDDELYRQDVSVDRMNGDLRLSWRVPDAGKSQNTFVEFINHDNKYSCVYMVPANSVGFIPSIAGWDELDQSQQIACSSNNISNVSAMDEIAAVLPPNTSSLEILDGSGVLVRENDQVSARDIRDVLRLIDENVWVEILGPSGNNGQDGKDGDPGQKGEKGDNGAMGLQGIPGPTGATGARGPAGQQGAIGPAGATGANGTSAYGVWLALGNTGSEQDFLNTLKGASGPQGVAGATGPTGATGPVGPQGTQGPKGDTGATGATGAVGPAGSSGADGASACDIWKGSACNSADQASFLNSLKGAAGAAGTNGATACDIWKGSACSVADESTFLLSLVGATGPQGPAGPIGNTGATGSSGANGASAYDIWLALGNSGDQQAFLDSLIGVAGATGATGATGAQGPAGQQGAQGPKGDPGQDSVSGLNYLGPFNSGTTYIRDDTVMYNSSTGNHTYVCINTTGCPAGGNPETDASDWAIIAFQGPTGQQGPQGPTGAQGQQGVQGIQGATGATGATGQTGASACDIWKGSTCNSSDNSNFLASLMATYTAGYGIDITSGTVKIDIGTSCSTGQLLTWDGNSFSCTADEQGIASVIGDSNITALTAGGQTSLSLSDTGVTAGTYGTTTKIPQFVVDAKGRITSVTEVNVAFPAETDGVVGNEVSQVAAGGGLELTGTGTSASPLTVGLITSCANNQLLKYTVGATSWGCASDNNTVNNSLTYNSSQRTITITDSAGGTVVSGQLPAASGSNAGLAVCDGLDSNVFCQNGNNFGADAVLGTKDDYGLLFFTDNTERMAINANGTISFITNSGYTNAFSITNGSGNTFLNIDTNGEGAIKVGDSTGTTATLLTLDGTSSDPSVATNGSMYYNTAQNKFRCYEGGAWKNCIGSDSRQSITDTAAKTRPDGYNTSITMDCWVFRMTKRSGTNNYYAPYLDNICSTQRIIYGQLMNNMLLRHFYGSALDGVQDNYTGRSTINSGSSMQIDVEGDLGYPGNTNSLYQAQFLDIKAGAIYSWTINYLMDGSDTLTSSVTRLN